MKHIFRLTFVALIRCIGSLRISLSACFNDVHFNISSLNISARWTRFRTNKLRDAWSAPQPDHNFTCEQFRIPQRVYDTILTLITFFFLCVYLTTVKTEKNVIQKHGQTKNILNVDKGLTANSHLMFIYTFISKRNWYNARIVQIWISRLLFAFLSHL